MMARRELFGLFDQLDRLSKDGDPLEFLERTVEFEYFRPWLLEGLGYGDGKKGGRPPFDPVSMFKAMILQTQHNLSDARMEFMIRDRLSWMRFLGFELGAPMPDESTIRLFREKLTESGALRRIMKAFDWQLKKKGYIPMSGQIVDASLVPAPKQRNTTAEKEQIKDGKTSDEIWPDEPNKAAQKDTDARWIVQMSSKTRHAADGTPLPPISTPFFGYKSHLAIDRAFGFIRSWIVTPASTSEGSLLRSLLTTDNTSSNVWADSAYRSKANERWLAEHMLNSQIHRKKPRGRAMPKTTASANANKSRVRAAVEHVFARQKTGFGLMIRTIGLARAETKIGLANLAYNMNRLVFHEHRAA